MLCVCVWCVWCGVCVRVVCVCVCVRARARVCVWGGGGGAWGVLTENDVDDEGDATGQESALGNGHTGVLQVT